ncbi:hypothetical protein GCM10027427_28620 [Pseudoclavibacter terrae]|uniref:ATP-binding protein n=2 Tax=Pseudoclavibacter terrae TaxID=1530195 RepID=A0A7J5AZF7_9MICO|nr:ATP-binding protein [Pseudoclavibacter terrae]
MLLAPNGAGKTHLLKLTAAALALDARILLGTSFSEFKVRYADGRELVVERETDSFDTAQIVVRAEPHEEDEETLAVSQEELDAFERRLPPEVRRTGPNRWIDERTNRPLSATDLERRYGARDLSLLSRLDDHPSIRALCGAPQPIFIDTWRLDARSDNVGLLGAWGKTTSRSPSSAASRIRGYTEKLRDEIAEARRASVRVTQSADLSFAARALAAAKLSVNESDLHNRYNRTVERYEALAHNGLAVGAAPIPFPSSTTPTVRRILSVFLDDWDQRLEPLLPVNAKLQLLREILDGKLAPSGKRTAVSPEGGLDFLSASGKRLLVSRLSSGEQHLVALFTLLLFAAQRGSLVLIDEPEISLHAAWKHSFLADISRIAAANDLQVVFATHSASIVNGRWDLAEELELPAIASWNADQISESEPEEEEDVDVDLA